MAEARLYITEGLAESLTQIKVKKFHEAKGHLIGTRLSKTSMLFRVRLIAEEFAELIRAMDLMDPVDIADALGDLEYVVNGTAVTFGFPLQAIVDEIHRSNMTKGDNIDGKPQKSKGFSPPDIAGVLRRHWKFADQL